MRIAPFLLASLLPSRVANAQDKPRLEPLPDIPPPPGMVQIRPWSPRSPSSSAARTGWRNSASRAAFT
jgi:hypothetical protein